MSKAHGFMVAGFRVEDDRSTGSLRWMAGWDLPAWMHKHLQAIDSRLMWEFGPSADGAGHQLVITLRLIDTCARWSPRS